ncbi:HD domain-containing phosphohydrolase [Peredibacter sp. HCB2-198]|uniref:HD domain-containing phosphohydrolase n=1 Tax=Peredibacter sp. HCB2-198 TaxID=3383025 RepID=UPI0038B64AA4
MDPNPEILNLQETALSCFYSGEIFAFEDSLRALEVIQKKGVPEMIIMDHRNLTEDDSLFYRHLDVEKLATPLIVCSENAQEDKFMNFYPLVTAMIEKPLSVSSFTYLVKSISTLQTRQPTHVPIKIPTLLRLGMGHFDLYLKLSDKNFVKIIHKGEPFFDSDANKLFSKGIRELFIKYEDSKEFLKFLEKEMNVESGNTVEGISLAIENVEAIEQIAKFMNWSPSVLVSAQKSVSQAVKILSKNNNIISVLKRRLANPTSAYSRHVGLLTYMVCAFGSSIGWIGESGQVKLAMAALLHDVAVDEAIYENLREWDKRASHSGDKSPDTIRYRMHPFEASKLVKTLDAFSPDVDQIILQHHEVKDGSGFPRALDSVRIGHLPALFIIVEDLVDFIDDGENIETSITDFITWGREYYDSGHFKKIFTAFEEKLKG